MNQAAYPAPRPPSNGLGVAGFIVSLVGLLATCGALSPVGLMLSGIALFKKPRGFAFAGVVLGLIGSVIISVIALGGVAAARLAANEARMQANMAERERTEIQIATLAERVGVYHQQNARPPLALDLLPYVDASMLTDPWGRTLEFEPDVDGFAIRSAGPDGVARTDDDVYQAWNFGGEGILPRPLATQPEDAPMFDESSFDAPALMDPIAPVPPVAPVKPIKPTAPVAPVAPIAPEAPSLSVAI